MLHFLGISIISIFQSFQYWQLQNTEELLGPKGRMAEIDTMTDRIQWDFQLEIPAWQGWNPCATYGPLQSLLDGTNQGKPWGEMGNLLLHFRKKIQIIDCKVDSDNSVAKYTAPNKGYITILKVCTPGVCGICSWASWYIWWCGEIWERKRKELKSSLIKSLFLEAFDLGITKMKKGNWGPIFGPIELVISYSWAQCFSLTWRTSEKAICSDGITTHTPKKKKSTEYWKVFSWCVSHSNIIAL